MAAVARFISQKGIKSRMIKFANLEVKNDLATATVLDVMKSGQFINGKYNKQFAIQWAQECNAPHCVLTASGTAALIATIKAVKAKKTDLVILPALSFAATAFAVLEAGCTPVYVDVDEHGLMRWDMVEEILHDKWFDRVAAIIPVNLYGQHINIPFSASESYVVIQDACQAHGIVKFNPDATSIACFSFYPAKNLGAIGDAGAVVTSVPGLAQQVAAYINYGDYPGEKYTHNFQGNNLRCDEIQAAYLSVAYKDLEENNVIRENIAELYAACGIESFSITGGKNSSHHLYPILVENPELFRRLMIDYGIETGNHYPYVLPKIAPGIGSYYFQKAVHIAQHVVTLPIGPHLQVEDVVHVAKTVMQTCALVNGLWSIKN